MRISLAKPYITKKWAAFLRQPIWGGRAGSNRRPPEPQSGILTN